jgi:hypothetical protein
MTTTPEAASPLTLEGAEGRVSRPCGLQGTPADRQSRIRGARLGRRAQCAWQGLVQ